MSMANGIARALNRLVGLVFPERRLFLRCERCTRYARLTPLMQLGAVVMIGGLAGWAGYATVLHLDTLSGQATAAMRAESRDSALAARLQRLEADRSRLIAARADADRRARQAVESLRATQSRLLEATGSLATARGELGALRSQLASLAAARRVAEASAAEAVSALAEAQRSLAEVRMRGAAEGEAMAAVNAAIARVIEERDRAAAEAANLDARVATLEEEIAAWEDRRGRVFTRLEEAARVSLDGLTEMFGRADLDVERILDETRAEFSGSGGPFLPVDEDENEGQADLRLAALMSDLERVNLMRLAAERVPFGRPVVGARMTSGFGKRRDPFRGRLSMHEGIDYAAPIGTPILATGEGTVTRVGWMGGYGRVVVVAHAFGFETRYTHLRRSLVKVGQRVGRGDRIAQMGSSGRSTGSHVHYEVRLNGQPVNPSKFIEAARDVL